MLKFYANITRFYASILFDVDGLPNGGPFLFLDGEGEGFMGGHAVVPCGCMSIPMHGASEGF